MKRVHTFEFEDAPWFPAWLRSDMTDLIVVVNRVSGATRTITGLVGRVLRSAGLRNIVDIGSGSGGAMPEVVDVLRKQDDLSDVTLLMTDLYPNPDAIQRFNAGTNGHLRYHQQPVDATDLAHAPPGLKTMINSFHHMRPAVARQILASASAEKQPLLIYELADNRAPFLGWCVGLTFGLPLVTLMAMVLTPFARPLTLRRLFFTYVIPVIPPLFAWDGQASYPRMYTFEDLDELLEGLDVEGYRWEKGYARDDDGRGLGTYLLGLPTR
ncbi:MAG: hypothetical protein AAFV53_24950 [Myxococcota bacterium]